MMATDPGASGPRFKRPEHNAVATALRALDTELLLRCRCWFGGGTGIVLDLGEYRLSKDIDFICADADGYRELRSLVVQRGMGALFCAPMPQERDARCDQYGIRGFIRAKGIPLRMEIIRESRVDLTGDLHPILGVPCLSHVDQATEKLLANADRCMDPATTLRDAIDLGMIAARRGPLPTKSVEKATAVYGDDVIGKAIWAATQLQIPLQRQMAHKALGASAKDIEAASRSIACECRRLWPTQARALPLAPRSRGQAGSGPEMG